MPTDNVYKSSRWLSLIVEFGGTVLTIGAIDDGDLLMRSGTSLVGVAGVGGGSFLVYDAVAGAWEDSNQAFNLGTTSTVIASLRNTTAATVGVPVQYSPILLIRGQAWDTDDLVSRREAWGFEVRPVSAAAVSSALYFLRRQDGGAWISPASINTAGAMSVLYGLANPVGGLVYTTTGIGLSQLFYASNASYVTVIGHTARTDGANNIVIASMYDPPGAATSIVNAATMRLHSFGWISETAGPVYTYNELAAIYCDGGLKINGLVNGQNLLIRTLTEETTILAAASTDTAIQIPQDALVVGVSVYVKTVIPTAATFDVGVAGATTRYGTGLSVAAGTSNPGTDDGIRFYAAAAAVRITPDLAPGAATGVVRVTIHYILITAPTS